MEIKKIVKYLIIKMASVFRRSRKSKCIFYHDIHSNKRFTYMSTPIDMFESHINIIRKNGFEIVSEITNPEEQIEISFDDGFKGIFRNIEIINRLKVPVTIFVITSSIGEDGFLSREEIRELSQNPFIRIESHTHTHRDLSLLSKKELELELLKSKDILEEICNKSIRSVCYPKGIFSRQVVNVVQSMLYEKQYSSLPGNYYNDIMPLVRRRSLVQFCSDQQFHNILNGGDHILYYWYKLKQFK